MLHVSSIRPRLALASVLTVGLAMFALTALVSSATAADQTKAQAKVSGKATFVLGTGKAGKALKRQGVKVARIAPAKVKRLAGKRFRAVLKVAGVSSNPARIRVRLKGGLKFRHGKRAVPVRGLAAQVKDRLVTITGKVGGRSLRLFTSNGRPSLSGAKAINVAVKDTRMKLTGKAAKLLRKKLRLRKRIPAGPAGSINLQARKSWVEPVPTDLDPYFVQCGISGTSKAAGSLPPAAPMPAMSGAKTLAAGTPDIAWGFKASFRGYMGGTGSLHAVDGAGRDGAGPTAGFTFPVKDGLYKANDPVSTADDQAVINGKGAAVFCNPSHGFRVVISSPTIVIDGSSARIVADVDTNYFGTWTPAQRVDLAELNLDGITPFYNRSGSEIAWQDIPATLTADGAQAFCEPPSDDRPGQCLYSEGDELDSITATAHTAYDTGAGDAAAWDALAAYTKANLQFPLPNAVDGGCTLPEAAGGNRDQARTIDEYLHYNALHTTPADPPGFPWVEDGAKPAARPDLDGGIAVAGGGLDWGVIPGLRSSVSGNGEFNLAGGATGSQPWYGNGGTESSPTGYSQKIGAPTAYFTWPAVSGTYKDSGGKKQLVLEAHGRVAICNTKLVNPFWMGYATVISNPSVVIDGANSRITADVATRYRLSWIRGTVDVARFDAADAAVTEDTTGGVTTVEWALTTGTNGDTTMTAAGSAVLRMLSTNYVEGWDMQNPTVRVSFPAD